MPLMRKDDETIPSNGSTNILLIWITQLANEFSKFALIIVKTTLKIMSPSMEIAAKYANLINNLSISTNFLNYLRNIVTES